MNAKHKPSILFVYFTYTKQTLKVVEAMSEVLQGRGCDVHRAAIEFDDPRYAKRFETFPMPHPFREVLGMIPAELRRRPAKIGIPATVTEREYDLVVIGSPTWWLSTNVPIRSFLESDVAARVLNQRRYAAFVVCRRYWKHNFKTVKRLGTKRGGIFIDGIHFRYQGGQVRSLLSLISYLGSGQYRERYLGLKIPPSNLQEQQLEQARGFADALADRLPETATTVAGSDAKRATERSTRGRPILGVTRLGRAQAGTPSYGCQMGFLRHRDDEPVGERFLMREKLMAIGDDFWIENDQGERAYKVNGKAIRLRQTFVLENASGDEVARIQERKLSIRDKIAIQRYGHTAATVHKALVGIRARFAIDVENGTDMKAHGNVVDHEYEIERDGDTVATISKKWFRVRDSYGVDVATGEDAPLILAITVAIDSLTTRD